ncbi:alpha-L-fucosidase [soil metagenome]
MFNSTKFCSNTTGNIFSVVIFVAVLCGFSFDINAQSKNSPRERVSFKEKFQPTWNSLRANYKVPDWFNQAKFGIFIHWGLYAIPAYHNEWYAKHMYGQFAEWHTEHYGAPDKFGYKDFIPLFKAESYNPDAWAELFKKAGAKYVVPVAEHHDGFAMYDSALTRWDAKDMGPKRDLIGDLAKAVRKQNLVFGLSYHRMEHHTFMYPTTDMKTDLFDPQYADFYGPPIPGDMDDANAPKEFQADWLVRCKELVDKYQPQMVYFDNGVNQRAYDEVKLKFAAYYYNHVKEATIATNSWGYINDIKYRPSSSIIYELIDVSSKGGNLLLNISPKADGTIPVEQQKILLDVGKWLDVNGAAIYGSRAWTKFGEGEKGEQQFRFTVNKNALYVFGLNGKDTEATVKSLAKSDSVGKIKKVELLGHQEKLKFAQDETGLKVQLPNDKSSEFPYVLKISGLKLDY